MSEITTKELKIIDSIYKNAQTSQRDIARDGGFSLGLTNILVNRLIKKGYIKASKLNAKKVSYMITPQGLKEKARKSYHFMKRSFSVINRLKEKISEYALGKYSEGHKEFLILGYGELSDITELVLESLKLHDIKIIKTGENNELEGDFTIFVTTQNENNNNNNHINIWKEAEKLYGSSYEF